MPLALMNSRGAFSRNVCDCVPLTPATFTMGVLYWF